MTAVNGHLALITGAASGLGRQLAHRLAAEGARLALWDVDARGLETTKRQLDGQGRQVRTYVCDLSDRGAIEATAARVRDEGGPVEVLINNAGVAYGRPILEATDEEIVHTFAVNTLAVIRVTRAFLPGMVEAGRGHIATIASAAALTGVPRLADYCASKFAVFGFDEALRLELADRGSAIRTTVVCPFYIDTGMFAGVGTRFPRLLPILQPGDVADAVARAIRQDRRRVLLPPFVHAVLLTRVLPPRCSDALLRFFGVTRGTAAFRGRRSGRLQRDPARAVAGGSLRA